MTNSDQPLQTKDGLPVFRLGYGTLTLAKSQKNLAVSAAADLFSYAFERGIKWFDTAELYDNYEQLARFLKETSGQPFISTKSYAFDRKGLNASLDAARRRLGVETIDLFMLHEQVDKKTLAGHREAFKALLDAKEKGIVRYVGVSTHAVSVVTSIADEVSLKASPDPDFDTSIYRHTDVLFPLLSQSGYGLLDGTASEMAKAAAEAAKTGITVLGMKLFGGGHLLYKREAVVADALSQSFVSAWSVGMGSISEIETNLAWFKGETPDRRWLDASAALPRRLQVTDDCTRCGRCVARCNSGAMRLGAYTAVSDPEKCTLCSYCASVCEDMAIKIF